ncbi:MULTISPECIES: DUF4268 domain-containing protein [unclassified Flavobacterium]|uniref:DUF4268 domain-containing protein n=1 Tax=unclassified Flavobacterium TaxID=196869 RepID=UPI001F138E63|nr:MULTISPECIES: DUF4268 domain-containing protein [unclassified Flavobacterium]UMY65490.1 DUF4268 domain-containing protein [Flavobacterium sp. HJ-32-4]
MYSKEETQRLKREFWTAFAERYPRKWLLYDTKIKDVSLKFHVDNKKAMVLLDIESRDDEKRAAYFDKLQSLQSLLESDFGDDFVFEKDHYLENGKPISRISTTRNGLSLSRRDDWNAIFDFFADRMNALESFFLEYADYIRDI